MYKPFTLLSLLTTISPSLSFPSTLLRRATAAQTCEQYNPITTGAYEVQKDAWGAIPGGRSCVELSNNASGGGDSVAWSSTFNWGGEPNAIKAIPNAQAASKTPCKPLSEYQTMPSTFDWSITTPITGDVAYDAFLNPVCNGPGDKHIYEIMVWLAKLGTLQPIGSPTSPAGIQLAGHSKGTNTQTGTEVFSFVAHSELQSFQGDLMEFFNYLIWNQGVDAGLKMTSMQAGFEVSVGEGRFAVTDYNISST
ncbi:MAG: hypothetical protein L6R42_007825 [Xanthoria sp. 1 TBL-2021]|nr:MAG: hypothetical protein L6R42_007825 [Xanthoria sp. 1 TBL-2021]